MAEDVPAALRSERRFFMLASLVLSFVVIGAFTPSFFLRASFHRPAPTPFIALHGVLMTGWMLLFAVQSGLVTVRQLRWHRRLGYAAVAFAALLVPVGCMATLAAAAREVHARSASVGFQLGVLGLELGQMGLFASFVAASTILRSRPGWHKRLMLMATLCVLPNAIVRLSLTPILPFLDSNLLIMDAWVGVLAVIMALDAHRIGHVHAAFAVAIPLGAIVLYAMWAVSRTPAWEDFWVRSLA